MKVKALRYKKEFDKHQEFVMIDVGWHGEPMVLTSAIPKLQPETATLEEMKKFYEGEDYFEGIELDWDSVELVELDLIDSGVVGADIRNKLTPPLNLLSLLKVYFDEDSTVEKEAVMSLIKKEMKQSEESIRYIANLL